MSFGGNGGGTGSISGSSDVFLSSPADNQVLTYSSGSLKWVNSTLDVPVTSVAGRTGSITLSKTDVGLSSADNTSDVDKPVSTLQAAADITVLTTSGLINVKNYGTLGTADDTAVFQAALNDAAATGSGVVVAPGAYNIEGLTVPAGVVLGPDTAGLSRFGLSIGSNNRKATVNLRRTGQFAPNNTSTAPMVSVLGAGAGLRNVQLEGKGAPGTILVMGAFESTLENVRCISGTGIGLDVQKANNTRWRNVIIDDCGGVDASLPAMKIWSANGVGNANETNTFDIDGLTIERSKNVALEIAVGSGTAESWAEWVRIFRLHVESSYLDSPNADPLIRIGNVRALSFIDPFIYGGSNAANGCLIRHEEQATRSYGQGGIRFIGGTILGPDAAGSIPMATAVDLVSGDDISFIDTRFLRYSTNAIKVGSAYGSKVFVSAASFEASKNGSLTFLSDTRIVQSTVPQIGNLEQWGHITSKTAALKPTTANQGGTASGSILSGSTDTQGILFFGSGASPNSGLLQVVTFNKPYARQPTVVISPGNAVTAALGLYVGSTVNDLRVYALNAPAASQGATVYQVTYHVIG